MENSPEKQENNQEVNYSIVFNVLAYGAIPVYALLLYLLDSFVGPSPTSDTNTPPEGLLPIAFLLLTAISLVIVQKIILPKANQQTTAPEAFGIFLIVVVLIESIALYGLLLGLLDLFVYGRNVVWMNSGPFIIASFIYAVLMIKSQINPRMQSLTESQ